MNLRSLEKVNLKAASIRSNESSESLMLFIRTYQLLIPFEYDAVSADDRKWDSRREEVRTIQVMPIFLEAVYTSNYSGNLLLGEKQERTRFGTGSNKDAGRDNLLQNHQCPVKHRALGLMATTHIEAISFMPIHLRTSWTIILSFPFSPVSSESGTEMGGPSSMGSGVTCCLVAIIGVS